MKGLKVVRAKISSANLEIEEENLCLIMSLKSTAGGCRFTVNTEKLQHLFEILEIKNFNQLKGSPCIAVIEDQTFKDLGSFMWTNYEDLYGTGRKAPSWIDNVKNNWLYGYLTETDEPIVFE